MTKNIYIYIFTMALTVFIIRTLPLTLVRKPIKNNFIRSFLYYIPYITLSLMTFPAILKVTTYPIAGVVALIIGIYFSYRDYGLFKVTVICCLSVYLLELLLKVL